MNRSKDITVLVWLQAEHYEKKQDEALRIDVALKSWVAVKGTGARLRYPEWDLPGFISSKRSTENAL